MSLYKYVGPKREDNNGFASAGEERLAKDLEERGVEFEYEPYTIPYKVPERKGHYKPDFVLKNNIIIEYKAGVFEAKDRQKMILVKESNPQLDIRFVFGNSKRKLYTGSKTTYAMWCDTHGFPYAEKKVPTEWLT